MDDKLKAAAQQGPDALMEHLWATKYLPAIQQEIAEEQSKRADAFYDKATLTVLGEELRLMTPHDFVFLDGMGSPFIIGGAEPTIVDVIRFIWTMHVDNDGTMSIRNSFRRGRVFSRITRNYTDRATLEVFEYIDRIFIDLPTGDGKESGPPANHLMAPLLVKVAAIIGPIDPMNGRSLGDTPIPRLIQYRRAAEQNKGEKQYGVVDSRRVHCVDEVNRIMAELRST